MFQNVAEMGNQKRLENKSSNIRYRLKEIFKYQNIIIYFLTFFISTLSIKGDFTPFGLAIMAACVGETVPIIGVFIMAIIRNFYWERISLYRKFYCSFNYLFYISITF